MPGEVYALFGAMLFGSGHIAVRKAQDDGWSSHNVLLSVTIINLVCFLAALSYLAVVGQLPSLQPTAIGFFALGGLFTVLLGRSTLFASIERIGASRAASYRVTSPLATVALAYVVLGERLSVGALIGAAVVIFGVLLLTRETRSREVRHGTEARLDRVVVAGIVLGLASAACFGTGQVFRKLGLEISSVPVLGTSVGTFVALLALGPTALRGGRWREMVGAHRSRIAWPILAAGLTSALAQYNIFYAYERSRVSTASVLGATEPVWTLLAASLLMRRQESPTWRLALSIAIICGGSAMVVASG
jgi:drug/metabolite transporter (DMT)-like permease